MVSLRKYFFVCIIFLLPISIAFSNITVSIGDVAVTGYTEDIVVPVTVTNPEIPPCSSITIAILV